MSMNAGGRKRLWNIINQSPYNEMSDVECLAALKAKTESKIVSKKITERDILPLFPTLSSGETFLKKLEVGGAENDVLARALRWFKPSENGIDVGHGKTRAMLDALVGAFNITKEEVDIIKGAALVSISPEELYKLGQVKLGDIILTRKIYG